MLSAARRWSSAAASLWRGAHPVDRAGLRQRVKALRRRFPDASRDELCQTLVYGKCMQVGAVGAATAMVDVIPGVRRLGGSLLGAVVDEAMVTRLQSELVAEIFELYDVALAREFERVVIASITAGHLGATAAAGGVARQIARHSQYFLGAALSRVATPLAGVATAAAGQMAVTYAIGSRARSVAKLRRAGISEWPDLLREFAMLDERKIARWATTATRAAVDQASTAAQAWMRQLGALMPPMPKWRGWSAASTADGAGAAKPRRRKPAAGSPTAKTGAVASSTERKRGRVSTAAAGTTRRPRAATSARRRRGKEIPEDPA